MTDRQRLGELKHLIYKKGIQVGYLEQYNLEGLAQAKAEYEELLKEHRAIIADLRAKGEKMSIFTTCLLY